MITVDIPMYYNRWQSNNQNINNNNNNNNQLTFMEGIKEAASCKIVSGKYEDWKEDFSWMLGYFSFAVWTSIYLINGLSP